ncbi:hypothetical protein BDP67DRAFT_495649 [Colletotrichum lupini]|nr:hypothetical protein BDP67DRAFT_495649 [Colletotrichum lupini]
MCSTSMLCVPMSPSFPPYLSIPLLTRVQFPLRLQLLLDGLSLNLAKRKKLRSSRQRLQLVGLATHYFSAPRHTSCRLPAQPVDGKPTVELHGYSSSLHSVSDANGPSNPDPVDTMYLEHWLCHLCPSPEKKLLHRKTLWPTVKASIFEHPNTPCACSIPHMAIWPANHSEQWGTAPLGPGRLTSIDVRWTAVLLLSQENFPLGHVTCGKPSG